MSSSRSPRRWMFATLGALLASLLAWGLAPRADAERAADSSRVPASGTRAALAVIEAGPPTTAFGPTVDARAASEIVHTGIQLRAISEVDVVAGQVTLAFDVWFRQQGEIDPNSHDPNSHGFNSIDFDSIEFDNAVEPLQLAQPVDAGDWNGVRYTRFSTIGRFRLNYSGLPSHYPRQRLEIVLHQRPGQARPLVFTPDSESLPFEPGAAFAEYLSTYLRSGGGWRLVSASQASRLSPQPMLGNPRLLSPGHAQPGFIFSSEIAPLAAGPRHSLEFAHVGGLALGLLAALVLLHRARRHAPLKSHPRYHFLAFASLALVTLFVGEGAVLGLPGVASQREWAELALRVFDCLWWLLPAGLLNLALHRFVWTPLEAATQQAVPRVAKDFTAFLIFALATFGIVSFVFERQLTGLLATSGLLAMIVGLAIQMNLSHIFSGIALNIERPFRPGDWVKIGDWPVGRVVDISWRSTKLETFANTLISIPNSRAADSRIENFSHPNKTYRIFQTLHFGLEHDPERLTKLLHDALRAARGADGRDRLGAFNVEYKEVNEDGQQFLVSFDCANRQLQGAQEHAVLTSIYKTLAHFGIHPAASEHLQGVAETLERLLERIEIFAPLGLPGRAELARHAQARTFAPGEVIVAQGAAGESLFLIAEGVVAIEVSVADTGQTIEADRIATGDFFGEMTLLTGEPRSATVRAMDQVRIYEIPKRALEPFLAGSAEMARQVCEIMAGRVLNRQSHIDANTAAYEHERRKVSGKLFDRIRDFFALSA